MLSKSLVTLLSRASRATMVGTQVVAARTIAIQAPHAAELFTPRLSQAVDNIAASSLQHVKEVEKQFVRAEQFSAQARKPVLESKEDVQVVVDTMESVLARLDANTLKLRSEGKNEEAARLENLFFELCDKMEIGKLEERLKEQKELVKKIEVAEKQQEQSHSKAKSSSKTAEGSRKVFSKFSQSIKKTMKLGAKVAALGIIVDLIQAEIEVGEKVEEKLKKVNSDEAYKEVAAEYAKNYANIYEDLYEELTKDLDPATKKLFESIKEEIIKDLNKNAKENVSSLDSGVNKHKIKNTIKELMMTDHKLIAAVSMVALATLGAPSEDVLKKISQGGSFNELVNLDKARIIASVTKSMAVKPGVVSEKFFSSLDKVFTDYNLAAVCKIHSIVYNVLKEREGKDVNNVTI